MRGTRDLLRDQFSRENRSTRPDATLALPTFAGEGAFDCAPGRSARHKIKTLADRSVRPTPARTKASRPTVPCDGPRMNPSVDVGNPPRPFRHLRMAERCSPDPSSSRVPVHSALVQKSVTAITNLAGRLSIWMLGKTRAVGKWKTAKSWQDACNQSNQQFTNGLARCGETTIWVASQNIKPSPQRTQRKPQRSQSKDYKDYKDHKERQKQRQQKRALWGGAPDHGST